MARAHNIFVVQNKHEQLLGAFTVKYECVDWIVGRINEFGRSHVSEWKVTRAPDGRGFEDRFELSENAVAFAEKA